MDIGEISTVTSEESIKYLKEVIDHMDRIKKKGGHALYLINARVTPETANYVKDSIDLYPGHRVELRPCTACTINTWDILIFF